MTHWQYFIAFQETYHIYSSYFTFRLDEEVFKDKKIIIRATEPFTDSQVVCCDEQWQFWRLPAVAVSASHEDTPNALSRVASYGAPIVYLTQHKI